MMNKIKSAIVLAAGRGTRMQPLTNLCPKPLIQVKGKALLDWILDDLATAGIEDAVVNAHYKAEMLEQHLEKRTEPSITMSIEEGRALDTGGGVANALSKIGEDVFIVTNSDNLWKSGIAPAVKLLHSHWEDNLTCLILLAKKTSALGYAGKGDFFIGDNQKPQRRGTRSSAPYIYSGTQLIHKDLFEGHLKGRFSFNRLWDNAIAKEKIKAITYDDFWYHVGTPEALQKTEKHWVL
jgi:MurNAc alpha-1-phosphate uridylyltransferase